MKSAKCMSTTDGAGQSRAYAAADDKGLGNGGINDPAGELLGQALELTEDTALTGQVLAHCEYVGSFATVSAMAS